MLEWARRAEQAGFSSLGTLDRLVYPNYEPLVALGAVAAVTDRIELTTAVLLVPFRQNAAVLAKQAATLHHLSGHRLTLGVGIGSRDDDYEASGVPMKNRGRVMDEMLDVMKRLWAGEDVGYAGGVGPDVGDNPPRLIVGGGSDNAMRRVARFADGWVMGTAAPDDFRKAVEKLTAAWKESDRSGTPRKLVIQYFALGEDPERDTRASIGDYYSFAPDYAEYTVATTAKGDDQVRERVSQFEEAGADELILFPASADPEQVDLLAAAVL